MRPSSLGGGRILRRTVCPSVCLSVRPVTSVTSRHLANYNDTKVLFATHRGPHIVRPSRPHKLVTIKLSLWLLSYRIHNTVIWLENVKIDKNCTYKVILFYNQSSQKSESEKSQVSRIFKTGVTPMSSTCRLYWVSDYCERLRVRVLLVMMTLSDNDYDNDESCYVL